jgi:hypothetical protein
MNLIKVEPDLERVVLLQYLINVHIIALQHNMEVIKVEPDLDTESLNGSPIHEDPLSDENQDQDPLLIKSVVVKSEVKVSFLFCIPYLCNESISENIVPYLQTIVDHMLLLSLENFIGLVSSNNM